MPERVEDVSILIDGARWESWDTLEIKRSLTSMGTVGFVSPFEPERALFRSTFQPFTYKPLELAVGDETVFTGTMPGVVPDTDPTSKTVKVTGYSSPAVLSDVVMPASAYPLEINGLSLEQVATTLLEPFGIDVQLDGDEGATFRRVAIKPTDRVLPFLIELAKQRGLVISDTAAGALRFWKSAEAGGSPVARFREGEPPLRAVSSTFAPQQYFSEITGIAKARSGRAGSSFTVQNPRLEVLRPGAVELDDTDDADVPTATEARLGRMFGNALAVSIGLPTWRTSAGELWTPNTAILLEAPGAMIYRQTEFLIRTVALQQDGKSQVAELGLVLPGAFSGEAPAELPWD